MMALSRFIRPEGAVQDQDAASTAGAPDPDADAESVEGDEAAPWQRAVWLQVLRKAVPVRRQPNRAREDTQGVHATLRNS